MNVLTSDFECTTFSKGHAFDQRNKAVCLGVKLGDGTSCCYFDDWWVGADFPKESLYVFFNAKYDLHWYRKCGVDIAGSEGTRVWCCQIAEFLLSGQKERYPSLDETAGKYGLGQKIDVVKMEYWEKGIDTDQIPQDVLGTYCCQDVDLTYQVYLRQLELFNKQPKLFKLFKLMCQDLLVLEEMEWNGLKYDKALCAERSGQIVDELASISAQLQSVYPGIPINFGSGDQLSAFLYGGTIYEESKEHVGFFKSGAKAGQPKYKNITLEHKLPRLVAPHKGTELKKDGVWKTSEDILRKLKGPAAKLYVKPLLRLSELQKLNSTYYQGLPKLAEEKHWEEGMIYGQFNQVVAQTGRLSSSSPNLQNFAGDCLDIFVSRYDN